MKRVLMMLVFATACGERGSGDYAFENRKLSPFSEVENRGEANVYVAVEAGVEAGEVTITGDDNLLDTVRTVVVGDRLIVDTRHSVWPAHELRLITTVPALGRYCNEGSGDSHLTGIHGDLVLVNDGSGDLSADGELTGLGVRSNGSGDTELTGSVARLDVAAAGSGDVHARDLIARDGEVTVNGSGSVEVCVTRALGARIAGSGDIDYYCHPDVVRPSTSGSGDITGH